MVTCLNGVALVDGCETPPNENVNETGQPFNILEPQTSMIIL
jgi:hypothetical protein